MTSSANIPALNIPAPTAAQTIKAVRATDLDGEDYWFCSFSGTRIETHSSRPGHFCPGCNVIAPSIVRVRSYRS
ncbi:hypothetical protein OG440_38220 (plasmid) [Streptomyces sp. NBC_00637]|uniref:hypothetical protein n=1 Tax=Streptomyces sp. NBC_00637 TaxID=2903667 RepID=UPI002F90B038